MKTEITQKELKKHIGKTIIYIDDYNRVWEGIIKENDGPNNKGEIILEVLYENGEQLKKSINNKLRLFYGDEKAEVYFIFKEFVENEKKYLKEFLEYHKNRNFDNNYICNEFSDILERQKIFDLLNKYVK